MPNNSNMTYITIPADTHSTNETNEYKTVGFSPLLLVPLFASLFYFKFRKSDIYRDEKSEEDKNRP